MGEMGLAKITRQTFQPHDYLMGLSKRIFTAIWLIANLAAPIYAFAESAPRTVLIVDESAPDSRFGHRFIAQVHSTLDAEARQRYAIHAEFLDLGHFNGPDAAALQQAWSGLSLYSRLSAIRSGFKAPIGKGAK